MKSTKAEFSIVFEDGNVAKFDLISLLTKKYCVITVPGDLEAKEAKELVAELLSTSDEVSIDDKTVSKKILQWMAQIQPMKTLLSSNSKLTTSDTDTEKTPDDVVSINRQSKISDFSEVLTRSTQHGMLNESHSPVDTLGKDEHFTGLHIEEQDWLDGGEIDD